MANLIQATVVNIGGNPQPIALSQAFLTSGIIMQENTVASSPDAVTMITYFSGPFANIVYYVTETVADLITAANTGTTSMIEVTVYEKNGDSFPSPISFGFPASAVVLKETSDSPVNTLVTCAGINYSVSETLTDIVTAANVGGGGGGAVDSVFGRTGVVTAEAGDYAAYYVPLLATGDVLVNMGASRFDILNTAYSGGLFQVASDGRIKLGDIDGGGNSNWLDINDPTNAIVVRLGATGIFAYNADYSANYTDRSLVDKAYVLAHSGSPAGSDKQIQFNNSNAFGADADLTFDTSTNILSSKNILVNRAAKQAYPLEVDGEVASYGDSFNLIIRNSGAAGSLRGFIGGDGSGAMVVSGATNQLRINGYSSLRMDSNIAISTTGAMAAPNASATLDIQSTTQGFGPPSMTTTQKNAISSPQEKLMVYDVTLHKLSVFTGTIWETIVSA